jgi:hypothetical protein
MRITSLRIAAAVAGRPGRRRLAESHLGATSRRCQASSVDGVTANISSHRQRATNRDSAASHSRFPRLVADPADMAAQNRVLVSEHQKLGILGHVAPGQHCQGSPAGSV